MRNSKEKMLLDCFSDDLRCEYLSDLRFLNASRKQKLAEIIKSDYPSYYASDFEWKDTFQYLTGNEPEGTAESIREKLIEFLCMHKNERKN